MLHRFLKFAARVEDPNKYIETHRTRYVQSLRMMREVLRPGLRVLELGGRSVVADFVTEAYGCEVTPLTADLRYDFDLPSESFDLVLNMEVLEHLKDRDSDNADYWGRTMHTGSGMESCLRECHRTLRPGGHMFLSTPNACSALCVLHIMEGTAGFNYRPHVRELSVAEVNQLCAAAGFTTVRQQVVFAWSKNLARASWLAPLKLEHPGDDILAVLRK